MPYSAPTAIPPRKSLGPNLRLNHHSTPLGGTDRRDRIGDVRAGPRTLEPAALFAPARKYQLDLARALIDPGYLIINNDKAESTHWRRQSLRFGGQRMKFDVRRDNAARPAAYTVHLRDLFTRSKISSPRSLARRRGSEA